MKTPAVLVQEPHKHDVHWSERWKETDSLANIVRTDCLPWELVLILLRRKPQTLPGSVCRSSLPHCGKKTMHSKWQNGVEDRGRTVVRVGLSLSHLYRSSCAYRLASSNMACPVLLLSGSSWDSWSSKHRCRRGCACTHTQVPRHQYTDQWNGVAHTSEQRHRFLIIFPTVPMRVATYIRLSLSSEAVGIDQNQPHLRLIQCNVTLTEYLDLSCTLLPIVPDCTVLYCLVCNIHIWNGSALYSNRSIALFFHGLQVLIIAWSYGRTLNPQGSPVLY